MTRGVDRYLVTDVSGQSIYPIFKNQTVGCDYRRFGTAYLSHLKSSNWLWLPTFRYSLSIPPSKIKQLAVVTDVSLQPIYPIFKTQVVGCGYRRFGRAHLSHLQNSSSWMWLPTFRYNPSIPSSKLKQLVVVTDVSGQSIYPTFKTQAVGCGYRRFGTAHLSHLQNSSSWLWLPTFRYSLSIPSSKLK